MIDRVRMWLNRPIVEGSRRTLFVVSVLVIVGAAVVMAAARSDPPRPTAKTTATAAPAPLDDDVVAPDDRERPSEEGHATGLVGSEDQIADAKRAARDFLAGYLDFTYGRGEPSDIDASTLNLRKQLAAEAPRVPSRERDRHARVVQVQANGAGAARAGVIALVDDGARRYTVTLELERRASRWLVTAAGA